MRRAILLLIFPPFTLRSVAWEQMLEAGGARPTYASCHRPTSQCAGGSRNTRPMLPSCGEGLRRPCDRASSWVMVDRPMSTTSFMVSSTRVGVMAFLLAVECRKSGEVLTSRSQAWPWESNATSQPNSSKQLSCCSITPWADMKASAHVLTTLGHTSSCQNPSRNCASIASLMPSADQVMSPPAPTMLLFRDTFVR